MCCNYINGEAINNRKQSIFIVTYKLMLFFVYSSIKSLEQKIKNTYLILIFSLI